MSRVRFYSDDSYSPNGQRFFFHMVVAGVAISADRENVTKALLEAESRSKKGIKVDWRGTPTRIKADYMDIVLGIPGLRGRVFYHPFDSLRMHEHSNAREDTLQRVIARFTTGRDCHHAMHHEGLKGKPRHLLRLALQDRGCDGVTVETAELKSDPEVRLSDALAGYIRAELYRGDGNRAALTNLPDWFENLEPERRNPPE